jgi:hypothetical protein
MISIDGQSNEQVVLDGEWFEKLRGGQPKTRVPASSFKSVAWNDIERRTKLFGGERETLVQVTLVFESGPAVGFLTDAEKRPQLEKLVAALAAASGLA